MIEGLLVISTFVLLFIGFIFIDRFYQAELQVVRASRAVDIAYALNSCQGVDPAGQMSAADARVLTPPAAIEGAGSMMDQYGKNARDPRANASLGKATASTGFGLPRETTTRAATDVLGPLDNANTPGGLFRGTVQSGDRVLCADPARERGIIGLLEFAKDFFN